MLYEEETISAIITAVGRGAVGIVRLSGPKALVISQEIFFAASGKALASYPSHTMVYGTIKDRDGQDVDEVLAVYMQAPRSYTAEDVVEIQCHGGVQSLRKILALTYAGGARPAEPGEFTKRAFLNGRLDLVQAEAVMDIINSRSEASLKNALRQQEGFLSQRIERIRQQLLAVLVNLEAVIDYPEEDIEDVTYPQIEKALAQSLQEVEQILLHAHTGKILREGLRTVIVGRPNVGKSSLLNMLLQEDRALVSEYAGTTRDVIEEQLLLGGIPLVLADTAGIHATNDFIEQMGIAKSKELLAKAELVIVVLDGTEPLNAADEEILAAAADKPYVLIVNKTDLKESQVTASLRQRYPAENILELSAKTRAGVDSLTAWLEKFVYGAEGCLGEGIYVQNVRQEDLLRQARQSLADALAACQQHLPYDCLSIDTRGALAQMGEITGATVRDEIINQIFAKFCVGK